MLASDTENLGMSKHWQPQMIKVIDGKAIRFRDVVVHEIRMGDVEDPDLMVADPMWRWQQTDEGQFIMSKAVEQPYWTRHLDQSYYGYVYRIVARLSDADECFWRLKWK